MSFTKDDIFTFIINVSCVVVRNSCSVHIIIQMNEMFCSKTKQIFNKNVLISTICMQLELRTTNTTQLTLISLIPKQLQCN
jgi:hypothetical protein